MNLLEAVGTALRMIRAHKLRAFFTVLGTMMGVTFLIAVVTLITGMDAYMKEDFAGKIYGFNSVMLRQRPSVVMNVDEETWRAWQRRPRLKMEDAEWLEERIQTPGILSVSSDGGGQVEGPDGKLLQNVRIVGVSASYFRARDMDVALGRVFSENEAERGVPLVVIGQDVADKLFEGLNPLDRTIRIFGFPYRIIGVLEKQGSLFGFSLDNVVMAPAKSRVNGYLNGVNEVDEISLKVPEARLVAAAAAEMEGLMRQRHRLRPGEPNTFEVETAEQSLAFWTRISQYMMIALPGLVGISLVVGAVVIMNIMLVVVTERTREIGLRKSLGARRRDILAQFMIEAGTLSGMGGAIGIGIGIGLAALVEAMSPVPARVSPLSIVLGILLGVGVGLVAGVYPAYRASRLDPIVALRQE